MEEPLGVPANALPPVAQERYRPARGQKATGIDLGDMRGDDHADGALEPFRAAWIEEAGRDFRLRVRDQGLDELLEPPRIEHGSRIGYRNHTARRLPDRDVSSFRNVRAGSFDQVDV